MTDEEDPYVTVVATVVVDMSRYGEVVSVSTKAPEDMPLWAQAKVLQNAASMMEDE